MRQSRGAFGGRSMISTGKRNPNAPRDWRIPREQIHRALEHMFAKYQVEFLFADPWKWQSELEHWSERWPNWIVEAPTNSTQLMAAYVDRFRVALQEGQISHDGDEELRRHVVNARLRKVGRDEDGRGRYTLEKAGPRRLIDACVASVLAYAALAQVDQGSQEPLVMVL